LATVERAQGHCGATTCDLLAALGLDAATYYRWRKEAQAGGRPERKVGTRSRGLAPTPAEVEAVQRYALEFPRLGARRLTWRMVDDGAVGLKPHQVLEILRSADLLARRKGRDPKPLRRPPPPERPNEVWHIDLMYVQVGARWFYLVDILDGYSRYLVHWTLNATMLTDTVVRTVAAALAKLETPRPVGEPRLVHDNGPQFVSRDWQGYLAAVGATSIRTRVAHPESNGKVERLHRTHRDEGGIGGEEDSQAAIQALEQWEAYYNWKRPHSALNYLTPGTYYCGDPEAELARRAAFLGKAKDQRAAYWASQTDE
jgi:putative transposase